MILWSYQSANGVLTDLTGASGVDETGVLGAWMPEYETLTRDVPGGSGQVIEAVRGKARQVTVPLVVQDPGRSGLALDRRLAQLTDDLAPEDGAGLLLATLADDRGRVLLDELGDPLTRQLRCWYTGGLEISRAWGDEYGGWWQVGGLVFQADVPYWQPRRPRARTFGTARPTPWLPILPLVLGSDSLLGASTEVNDGAVPAYAVWTLHTPGTSFTASNDTTGESFTVDTADTGGLDVIVDTRPTYLGGGRSVSLADGTGAYERLSGGLWAFARGVNNLTIEVPGGTPGTTGVDLLYSPLYRVPVPAS